MDGRMAGFLPSPSCRGDLNCLGCRNGAVVLWKSLFCIFCFKWMCCDVLLPRVFECVPVGVCCGGGECLSVCFAVVFPKQKP